MMPRIHSLRPNVTREEAIEQFAPGGTLGLLRRVVFGPLRSIADVYVPFRFFEVTVSNAGKVDTRILGLEAVSGQLDLYEFEQLPDASRMMSVETRNCPPARLDVTRANQLVIEKVRRIIFTKGFFRMRDLSITAAPLAGDIHIPYWIGFRGTGIRARISVIDAIRRRLEGAKLRHLLQTWLTTTGWVSPQTNHEG